MSLLLSSELYPKSLEKLSEKSIMMPSVLAIAIASGEFLIRASNKLSLIFASPQ